MMVWGELVREVKVHPRDRINLLTFVYGEKWYIYHQKYPHLVLHLSLKASRSSNDLNKRQIESRSSSMRLVLMIPNIRRPPW